MWFAWVLNAVIEARNGLPHIGILTEHQWHALWLHTSHGRSYSAGSLAPLKDIGEGRQVPQDWRCSRGRSRYTSTGLVKADSKLPISTACRRTDYKTIACRQSCVLATRKCNCSRQHLVNCIWICRINSDKSEVVWIVGNKWTPTSTSHRWIVELTNLIYNTWEFSFNLIW